MAWTAGSFKHNQDNYEKIHHPSLRRHRLRSRFLREPVSLLLRQVQNR